MEAIKQELVEAGVIGRVVDDFDPDIHLILFYSDKRISLGEELSLADAGLEPNFIHYRYDPDRPGLAESFRNPTLITLVNLNIISS